MAELLNVATLGQIERMVARLPGPDADALAAAEAREPSLTKPPGSLGRLEELSAWLAAWQGTHPPRVDAPRAAVFAGNHGVAALGVSAYPAEVTAQMVANFETGGAAINQLCKTFGASLDVYAMDLDAPTADFTRRAAMTEAEFVGAFSFGLMVANKECDVLCLGEMGIANTTAAAAICAALYGGGAVAWAGPGTGVEGAALDNKIAVVDRAVTFHSAATTAPMDVLRCLGGRELAAIAGAITGARMRRLPVLLDGFVCTAAAAALHAANPRALDHCRVAHVSAEPGHRALVANLGQVPLLDLGMRLGEASGAVLALGLVKAAVACHAGMATFEEAAVSNKD
jgi:nicotinate-nucleotide--dimethylbenzimidazole phosphoribosyltransferase